MIIDCHGHCTIDGSVFLSAEDTVEGMDRYGVDQVCSSAPILKPDAEPEQVRTNNDLVLAAMRRFPERILGLCFVNPGFGRETQDEITRCVVEEGCPERKCPCAPDDEDCPTREEKTCGVNL